MLNLPDVGKNNIWYRFSSKSNVLVFVHGIFSDSRSCWLWDQPSKKSEWAYWPNLIREDQRFENISIFLGGFYTAPDAGPFDARQASKELFGALNRKIGPADRSIVEFPNILFVCHSTGGIISRYLLYHHKNEFKDKVVGLCLIASPSYGSKLANRLDLLARFYNNALARQLQWRSTDLEELDGNFRNLVAQRFIPNLVGAEAMENHFIVHRKWLPFFSRTLVVDKESAGRYFASVTMLPKTNHFTSVKPNERHHPAYTFLLDFYNNDFKATTGKHSQQKIHELIQKILAVRGSYEASKTVDDVGWRQVKKKASILALELEQISDYGLGPLNRITKYEYGAYGYMLAASVETNETERRKYADLALKMGGEAQRLIQEVEAQAAIGEQKGLELARWLNDSKDLNRVRLILAIASAINMRVQGGQTLKNIKGYLDRISSDYLKDYPVTMHPDLEWAVNQPGG